MLFADSAEPVDSLFLEVATHLASTNERSGESAMALYPKSLARNHKKLDRLFR
jgi:hypothetical protein